MMKVYNKLVRDRIPEIIESDGKTCTTEILPNDRYLQMLDAKLNEELAELSNTSKKNHWKNMPRSMVGR